MHLVYHRYFCGLESCGLKILEKKYYFSSQDSQLQPHPQLAEVCCAVGNPVWCLTLQGRQGAHVRQIEQLPAALTHTGDQFCPKNQGPTTDFTAVPPTDLLKGNLGQQERRTFCSKSVHDSLTSSSFLQAANFFSCCYAYVAVIYVFIYVYTSLSLYRDLIKHPDYMRL